jgi:calcineurin-like phosphoesterase family protein
MQKLHIQLKQGQNLWFTSDLHLGHKNVIKFCDRPFADVKEMSEKIIENWNNIVNDDDIVFILGDVFWFNDSQTIKKILNRLKGIIYIIPGNHDDFSSYHRVVDDPRFILCNDVVQVFLETEDNRYDKKITELWLSHYPMMTWPHRNLGAINLFGHIHSKIDKTEGVDQDLPLHYNQCDVGCDYWDYKPVMFDILLEKIKSKHKCPKLIYIIKYIYSCFFKRKNLKLIYQQ